VIVAGALAGHVRPVRQVVGVGVGVIDEAAMLDHQPPRVGLSRPVYQPSGDWPVSASMMAHRLLQMGTLGGLIHLLIADPAQAVAGDLMTKLQIGRYRLRMSLQCARHPEIVNGSARCSKARNTRHKPARDAIFEQRFHAQVAHREGLGADDLGEEDLRLRITVEHAALRAFLVVEHELQGDARLLRPARMRRSAAIADQVARIISRHVDPARG